MAPTVTSTNTPSKAYGRLYLDVTHYPTHSALTVYYGASYGGEEVDGLARITRSNESEFAAIYWMIATAATNGTSGEDIAKLYAQDLAEAELVKATADGDLARVAQLNALIPTLMTVEQRELASRFAASVDVIAEIKAGNDGSDRQAVAKKTFADLNLGGHNTYLARRTACNAVNFTDPSPAQLALLRDCAANDGYAAVGDGTDERTMRAAARKMLGDLVYRLVGKRQVVKGFRASQRGLKAVSA